MSIIETWKCDGCGRISRKEPLNWLIVEVWHPRQNAKRALLWSKESVKRHACSVDCASLAIELNASEIEALEVVA